MSAIEQAILAAIIGLVLIAVLPFVGNGLEGTFGKLAGATSPHGPGVTTTESGR